MSRDELEKYTVNDKNYTIYEEERDGKFIFYAEGPSGEKIAETSANPADVIDPSKNITADLIKKIKEQIDKL
ncbi:MAG: hypothetical protein OEZ34_13035 [Spirochaetia bacterium]|nr:hypothetical protein [Spirochaetia bacterium]